MGAFKSLCIHRVWNKVMIGEDHVRRIGGVNEFIIWIYFPRSMSSIVGDIAKKLCHLHLLVVKAIHLGEYQGKEA